MKKDTKESGLNLLGIWVTIIVFFILGIGIGSKMRSDYDSKKKVKYDGKEWEVNYYIDRKCEVDIFDKYLTCYESVGLNRLLSKNKISEYKETK